MHDIKWTPLTKAERTKYEVAEELGLLEKLLEVGWSGLTARETGMIGAKVSGRMREP